MTHRKKNTVLFEPTSPGSSLFPATRAGGQIWTPRLGSPVLQGGLASSSTAPSEGPQDESPAQGKGSGEVCASPGMPHTTAGLQRAEPVGFAPQTKTEENDL